MKILFAHCRYQQLGGEDRAVEAEMAALSESGHEVALLGRNNATIRTPLDMVRTAWQLPGTDDLRRELRAEIEAASPDVIHAHNLFPLITPSLYDAASDLGIPVVQTLHNFRNVCASGLLMRAGKICEDCLTGSPYQAALHRCYRNSVPGSLALARMIDIHRKRGTWERSVAKFIALTAFSRSRFVKAGFPEERIAVKPNSPGRLFTAAAAVKPRAGALFVGRLSPEKGIAGLLRLWRADWPPLKVIGEGPEAPALEAAVRDGRAVALGVRGPEEIAAEMRKAAVCILPSVWYENFPMVLTEAFASSLPALVSNLGALREIVKDGVTGALFDPFEPADIERVIDNAFADPDRLAAWGHAARKHYETELTPERTLAIQLSIYREAINTGERV